MKRAALFFLAVFLLIGGPVSPQAQRTSAPKPNILLIIADDLGYADIGANGCQDVPTPNIDSIAKHGVRFTDGYVSGPYCSPTRAGPMTGRYQQRFGHEFNPGPAEHANADFGLPLSETTMADRLKAAGYATGMVGKWHLGYQPQFHPLRRGFDEYFGFLGGAHSYLENGDVHNPVVRGTEPVPAVSYLTEMFGDEAVAFIERHKAQPWFLYLPFNADHAPMHAKESYLAKFAHIKDPLRQKFAAMHAALDDQIGRVLETVRKHKLEENTLILFVSDNGGPTANNGSRNTPLRGFKAQTWEGGIRVPMLAQWKGKLSAGKVYAQPVIQLDFLPTVLAAAGIAAKAEWKLDGVNLLPYLTGKQTGAPHTALYWRFGPQIAIRMGDWKLVKGRQDIPQPGEARVKASTEGAHLYNLANDIGEQNDLATKEPAKFKQLAAAWDQWNAELIEAKWMPQRAPQNRRQ